MAFSRGERHLHSSDHGPLPPSSKAVTLPLTFLLLSPPRNHSQKKSAAFKDSVSPSQGLSPGHTCTGSGDEGVDIFGLLFCYHNHHL